MTEKGHEALQEELKVLVEEKRPKMVDRLSRARAEGDLSENSDYQNAKDELEFMDGKIAELKNVLKNAEVVEVGKNDGKVALGTSVLVKIDGDKHEYHVVGEWEANPAKKRISHTSPLGQALMGKKKGEKVDVEAPAGKVVYEILEIK